MKRYKLKYRATAVIGFLLLSWFIIDTLEELKNFLFR